MLRVDKRSWSRCKKVPKEAICRTKSIFPSAIGGMVSVIAAHTAHATITSLWRGSVLLVSCVYRTCVLLVLRVLVVSQFNSSSVAAGQVISRLKFTMWGNPGTTAETAGAFQTMVAITAAYFLIAISIGTICAPFDPDYPPFVLVLLIIRSCMGYAFLLYLIIVLWNLRSQIRTKYAIPESCNTGCDDLLCAVFCSHCTVAQMLRHTTDYDTYNASCCSVTGVPPHVPSIV